MRPDSSAVIYCWPFKVDRKLREASSESTQRHRGSTEATDQRSVASVLNDTTPYIQHALQTRSDMKTDQPTSREGFPLLTDPVGPEAVPLFVENLRRGAKHASGWMCGVEFELFG